jgi:uncharacterized protein YdgA (DUF945 family)
MPKPVRRQPSPKKSLKNPLIFVGAFLFALVTMPFVFGSLANYRLHQLVKDAKLPDGIILEIKSYDQGYLHSQLLMNVLIIDPKQLQQPNEIARNVVSFNVAADINHGPFFNAGRLGFNSGLAHIHAYLKAEDIAMDNAAFAQTLDDIFTEQEIVSLDATLSLLGALKVNIHSSDANYQADDGSVSWGGIDGTLYISGSNRVMKASLDVSPMLLQASNKSSLDFSRISIISDAHRKGDMPWIGEQSINVPSFFMRDETGREVKFSNLIFTAKSDIENELASVQVEGKANNLQLYTQAINDTQISMKIDRLDAKSLVTFSKVTQNDVNTLDEEEKRSLTHALVTMLSPGATFTFTHNMMLNEGPVNADISVVFPDLTDNIDKDPIETVAQDLMMKLSASLSMQTPSQWLEDTLYNIALSKLPPNASSQKDPQAALRHDINDQLKTLSQAGVLLNDGTNYSFLLKYELGNIILNGNKLSQEDITKLMNLFSGKQ